ncbi:MAG: ATP-dependent sacrificial sulfur transferase LarE [Planctomycetes bacterium]|nr:ATP-dependent sacrificial sulfur transferase LarE [Planctomycetota bacterium]
MLPATANLPYEQKLTHLRRQLGSLPGAVVAFSAGVDSTALLHACREALGDRVVAVTADSPSLPRSELQEARELAGAIGVRHVVLETDELARDGYRANAGDRCYHCKKELFVQVAARRAGIAPDDWVVVYGAITDDLGDHRPGQQAAREHGVAAPLVDAGFAKDDVRRYARDAGLSVADKPSFACLSSRVPYGTAIDREMLAQIERAEAVLRAHGFRQFRVRHHERLARVEVGQDELERAFAMREVLGRDLQACGYTFVALDVFGYRTGAMNQMLRQENR